MGRAKEPYTIVKPESKGGSFRYRLGTDPLRRLRSTGKKSRREAVLFCESLLLKDDRAGAPLKTFAADLFVDGKCPIQVIRRRNGSNIDTRSMRDDRSRLDNYILPEFGDIPLKDIKLIHWDHWMIKVESGKIITKGLHPHTPTPATINHVRRTFIRILDYAVRSGIIESNIMRTSECLPQNLYKARDSLSDSEINVLFPKDEKEMLKIWGSEDRVALFSLLLTAGIRSGEVRALRWKDILFKNGGIVVGCAFKYDGSLGTTKGKETRAIPLPEVTMSRLKKWKDISIKKSDTDFVFCDSESGKPIRSDTILTIFKTVLTKHKIDKKKNIVIHSLRHTYTTKMSSTLPIQRVMAMTGHKSVAMIARYNHPDHIEQVKKMREEIGGVLEELWA